MIDCSEFPLPPRLPSQTPALVDPTNSELDSMRPAFCFGGGNALAVYSAILWRRLKLASRKTTLAYDGRFFDRQAGERGLSFIGRPV